MAGEGFSGEGVFKQRPNREEEVGSVMSGEGFQPWEYGAEGGGKATGLKKGGVSGAWETVVRTLARTQSKQVKEGSLKKDLSE